MLFTFVPYLYGFSLSDDRIYLWLGYNFDDASVYLSWMRQAAIPSFKVYNLFTTESQQGLVANPLFLCFGLLHRLTGIPLIGIFHLTRFVFGITLLLSVWNLLNTQIKNKNTKVFTYLIVAFASGLGWLPFFSDLNGFANPIDRWQPEAITFLSLYLNPLFTASMTLQILILSNLLKATETGQTKEAIKAGIGAFILSLIHGYDIITIAFIWGVYLLTKVSTKEITVRHWRQTGIAALFALPAVLFMVLQYFRESVFRQRVGVPTLTPNPMWIVLGLGLPLLFALYAIIKNRTEKREKCVSFLTVWMVCNLLIAYAPVSFQRKMLQGIHIPTAILAGIGISLLIEKFNTTKQKLLMAGAIALLSLTNLTFLWRDMQNTTNNITQTQIQRPYLKKGEIDALEWVRNNTPQNTKIQPLPHIKLLTAGSERTQTAIADTTLATIAPWQTGRAVYCGHFGETPDYGGKLSQLSRFLFPKTEDAERIKILTEMGVKYLIFSQKSRSDTDADTLTPSFRGRIALPSYLRAVFTSEDADVYEVVLSQ
jgi:hypothetical protein